MKYYLLLLFIYLPAIVWGAASPPNDLPVAVKTGFYIHNVSAINEKNESISLEGILRLQWQDKRLAFDSTNSDKEYYQGEAASEKLNTIWSPVLQFDNMSAPPSKISQSLILYSDGRVDYQQHIFLHVHGEIDIHQFPFDQQKLTLHLASALYDTSIVKLHQDEAFTGIAKNAHLPEWKFLNFTEEQTERTNRVGKKISAMQMTLSYERLPGFYVISMMIPMAVIVLLAWTLFWLGDQPLINRMAFAKTCLLTSVAFQWVIFSIVPRVSYLVFLDIYVMTSFIFISLAIVASILQHRWQKHDKHTAAFHCQRSFRYVFPLAYVGTIGLMAWYFIA